MDHFLYWVYNFFVQVTEAKTWLNDEGVKISTQVESIQETLEK